MKSPLIKIIIFAFLTLLFISSMTAYSTSRSAKSAEQEHEPAAWASDEDGRRFEKTFTVTPGGDLRIDADAGEVTVRPWDKNEVNVVVVVDGSDSRVNKYTVDFRQEGKTVTVTGKIKDNSFFKWNTGNLEARYTVFVPKEFNTDISTSGGSVDVAEISGRTDCETSGGDITVRAVTGAVRASTSGGSVELRDINGSVDAETSGGDVVAENIDGDAKGHTSGGDVELRGVNGAVSAGTSGGSIVITVTGENQGIDAETSGGNIDIYVKEDVKATLEAETSGGSVDCDLPVTVRGKVQDTSLYGTVNGGGKKIHAETSGGSIRIAVLK